MQNRVTHHQQHNLLSIERIIRPSEWATSRLTEIIYGSAIYACVHVPLSVNTCSPAELIHLQLNFYKYFIFFILVVLNNLTRNYYTGHLDKSWFKCGVIIILHTFIFKAQTPLTYPIWWEPCGNMNGVEEILECHILRILLDYWVALRKTHDSLYLELNHYL